MATRDELNRQKQLNQEVEKTISLEQELINVLARRAGISGETLTDQQDIGNVLSDQLKLLKFQVQEKRQIRSVVTRINNLAKESYGIGYESLGLEKDRTKLTKEILDLESNIRFLDQQRLKFSKEEDELSQRIADSLGMQVKDAQQLRQELIGVRDLSEATANNFGSKVFGGLGDLADKIPGLREFSTPFKDAAESSRLMSAGIESASRSGGVGLTKEKIKQLGLEKQLGGLTGAAAANRLKGMSSASKAMLSFKSGIKALAPILKTVLAPLTILSAFSTANKEIVDLKKGLVLNNTEAVKFRDNLSQTADSTANINVTTSKLLKSFTSLNEQFGFITNFANETLATMTVLTNVVGVGAEAAGNLAAASSLTGGSFEDNYKDVLATSFELQRQSGVQMDLRNILEQSGKVTGTVRANLGANPALIAKAVTQAKLFGASLEDVASAGKALLDFESSIEAELQAELLLGRNINLERARAAALAGDQVKLAQELQQQAGGFEEFTAMNVIQQEALAQAMGMQSDQLADILFQQEIQGKNAKDLRALGKDELADRLESQTAAEAFSATMEKLQSVVVDVVAAFSPILDIVSMIAQGIASFISMLGPLKGVVGGAAAGSVFGLPGAVIGGLLGGISSLITMDDGIIPSGYGETIIKKGKDTIALNNEDSVVAGTNLGNGGTDMGETNQLLKMLVTQNKEKPQISPVGLYQVQ
jgi:hypothetical protein